MTQTPEAIDLLIESRWIAAVAPDVVLINHAVAVHNGRIVALLPSNEARNRFKASEKITLDDHILIPGLINLHTHAAMSLMRGLADDLPLMEWLQEHIWPAEAAHVSAQFVYDGTRLACAEMLLGAASPASTTCIFSPKPPPVPPQRWACAPCWASPPLNSHAVRQRCR
jgi:5-methylthioadenosine/S-adenosylhomocysteine deaminase